jgi:hypothetical protein
MNVLRLGGIGSCDGVIAEPTHNANARRIPALAVSHIPVRRRFFRKS